MNPLTHLTAALAGRYDLAREIGEGGMATVHLARDLKHDRDVAIKVLKPELGAVLGVERFLSEIKVTANLQHPNLLPLFDSGEAGGLLFYVMPFVEGETLRARIDREKQLPVDEAVRLAGAIAQALDYAHRRGVIHRDLKPENVLLADGQPLVADFGIALAVSRAGGQRVTQTGLSLGTPQYMSPEQATGDRAVDARTDIYSLGAMTYEMLTGEPPHSGSTAQAIIAKLMTEEVRPVSVFRRSVPAHVDAAVAQALEKLPADRFATAQEFAKALTDTVFRAARSPVMASAGAPAASRWKAIAGVLGVTTLAAAVVAVWTVARTDTAPRDVGLPYTAPMELRGPTRSFTASRDGSFIVYLAHIGAQSQLWTRDLRSTVAAPIPGTEGASGTPFLSPDGTRVAFQVGTDLRVTAIAGGAVTTLAQVTEPIGGEWRTDGTLFLGDNDGRVLRFIDIATGAMRTIDVRYCLQPQLMSTDRVLCGGGADKYAFVIRLDRPREFTPLRLATGGPDAVSSFLRGSHFQLIDERYLVYMSIDGSLMGARFENIDSLTVARPVALLPLVRRSAYSGVGQYVVTADGALIVVPGINADVSRVVELGRDGRVEPLLVDDAPFLRYAVSPDGRKLAAVVEGTQQQELRAVDLGSRTNETLEAGFFVGAPSWSPDGSSLAYVVRDSPTNERLLLRRLDSPEAPRVLLASPALRVAQVSAFLAPDLLMVGSSEPGAGVLVVDPTRTPVKVDTIHIASYFASLSPDRRWIAYQGLGVSGVQLQPWPALDKRYLASAIGTEPRWTAAGELVYLSQSRDKGQTYLSILRSRITSNASTPVGPAELLVRDPRFNDTPGWSHAQTSDGRVIYLQSPTDNYGYYLRTIPSWTAQMKRAVDAGATAR
ncbi:MAG: serine/threonine-protein kinase [Gemmatimonadaceae bacterium]|nr:serine/threonine-protein kinase [Gemmatimonadaceae bacterium]